MGLLAPRAAPLTAQAAPPTRGGAPTRSGRRRSARSLRLLPLGASVAVGVAAAWAAVSCFAPGGLPLRRVGAAAEARAPRRASNPLEGAIDAVKGAAAAAGSKLLEASADAVTGMSEEERNELTGRMMGGRTDFNDYVKMTMLMQNQGGIGGIASSLGSVQGLDKLTGAMGIKEADDSEKKLEEYCTVISAMTPQQRESPGIFLFSESKEESIQGLIKASDMPEETVRTFLGDFERMRFVFLKLGEGMRSGKSNNQISKEIDEELARKKEEEYNSAKEEAFDIEAVPEKGPRVREGQYINPARLEKRRARRANKKLKARPPSSRNPKVGIRTGRKASLPVEIWRDTKRRM